MSVKGLKDLDSETETSTFILLQSSLSIPLSDMFEMSNFGEKPTISELPDVDGDETFQLLKRNDAALVIIFQL
jgi:hypothetical protein